MFWISSCIYCLSDKCFNITFPVSGNNIFFKLWFEISHSVFFYCLFLLFCKAKSTGQVFGHLDFKLVVEPTDAPPFTVVLLAPSRQEKAAWTSDISQVAFCILYLVCHEIIYSVLLKTNPREN